MKYTIRIKNTMYGYERDQTMQVDAASEEEAIAIGYKVDLFAHISIEKPTITLDYEQIDCLVVTELQNVALSLCTYVLADGIDKADSLKTLASTLGVLSYYHTTAQFSAFINKIPEPVLDELDQAAEIAEGSILFAKLGRKCYAAMAGLGFMT